MSTRPLKHRFEIGRVANLKSSSVVERRIVYHSHDLAGGFVTQGEEVREIVFAELGIGTQQTLYATATLRGCLNGSDNRGERLHVATVFAPFLNSFFSVGGGYCHG